MTVVFRSDAEVVNGTAGTSVTVTKPSGIVDTGATAGRDHLLAFIASVGLPSITPPSGWNLIRTVAAGGNHTLWAYEKSASSEGASWTWTLGAAQRNWGWVGAYTGVDHAAPVYDHDAGSSAVGGTDVPFALITLHDGGRGVHGGAGVRAATGTATTWTTTSTERADLSTNAGAGTDIGGCVGDSPNNAGVDGPYGPTVTASQSQDIRLGITVSLMPAFVTYDGGRLAPVVEAAFGQDPDGDPDTWVWTDISGYVLEGSQIGITSGRGDATGRAQPTRVGLWLKNLDGRFTPTNPTSPYWPDITHGLPIRVRVPFGFNPPTDRAVAFVAAWRPRWDTSTNASVVEVEAHGRLRRIIRRRGLRSPMYRTHSGLVSGNIPTAYWPCEDGSGASLAASAVAGAPAMSAAGVTFATDSDLAGSSPLPTLPAGAHLDGVVPVYAASGKWWINAMIKVPAAPTVDTHLLYIRTTGTAATWTVTLVPGGTDAVAIRAYNSAGSQILTNSVAMGTPVAEADFYGHWVAAMIGVTQVGANIDYQLNIRNPDGAIGVGGTLNSNTHGNAVGVTAITNSETGGMGVGHVIVHTAASFDLTFDPLRLLLAMDGHVGETTVTRFSRLCDEEGIPRYETHDLDLIGGEVTMGPQPVGTLATALQECEDLDAGLIHDGVAAGASPSSVVFNVRHMRYNQTPTMTLDMAAFELAPGFEPEFDDQRLVNDVTVTRTGGSSGRVVEPASIATDGVYPTELTVNAEGDTRLAEIAGWHAHVGAADEMRYPALSLNLRRTPGLAQEWLATRIGSRVQATNLMATHPSGVDVIVEGWTERISGTRWDATLSCSPASPYTVAVLDSATLGKLDTDGSELAAAVGTSDTALLVATTAGPVWTVEDTEDGFGIRCGGERMTVTDIADGLRDDYGRVVSSEWGSPDSAFGSPSYSEEGGSAADYSTSGGHGRISNASVNVLRYAMVALAWTDFDLSVDATIDASPATGAPITLRMIAEASAGNSYELRLQLETSGLMTLAIDRRVGGTGANLAISTTGEAGAHASGNFWFMRLQKVGSLLTATTFNAAAPTVRTVVQATDTSHTSGTRVGLGARLETGNTNGTTLTRYDHFDVANPQTFVVTRSVNGIIKAHSAGTAVSLWTPAVLAL